MEPITAALIAAGIATNAYFGKKSRKKKKRARRAARMARKLELQAALGDLADQEFETEQAEKRASEELDVSYAERGLEDATEEEYTRGQIEEAKRRRLASIERRRAALIGGARAQDVIDKANAAIERNQFYASLTSSLLGGSGLAGLDWGEIFSRS